MENKSVKSNNTIKVAIAISSFSESPYIIDSNRKKFTSIANKKEWTHGDMIEMLLSLHIVLEVGLNYLFRHLAIYKLKKQVDKIDVIKNIDEISFKDKLTLFIYNSSFDFGDKLPEASEHHKIINIVKDFAGIRNKIMHGHAIATINEEGSSKHTALRKLVLTDDALREQISKYKKIVDGVNFYLDSLSDKSFQPQIQHYKKYIAYDFIPKALISNHG